MFERGLCWTFWILGCLLLGLATACGDSTETGNPPVIDASAFALHMRGDAVDVEGAEGAVLPGGTRIEVIDLATGASASTHSNADGSFSLTLASASGQAFAIRASNAEGASEESWRPSLGSAPRVLSVDRQ